ncbi:MAG: peptidylprolyl isomerase [Ignavibacteriaceae bacterium]|jgi:hypothetical protein|nr:peptidylprolyl isomerase [Ignavibacteriaceae bacterium]
MKRIIFICLFLVISGCKVFQPEESNYVPPALIKQASLPPLQILNFLDSYEFDCLMRVNCCGDVVDAKILTTSGNVEWDSLARLSLLDWKYSPAIYEGRPVELTIKRKVRVIVEEPQFYSLAEIEVQNYSKADSVYKALLAGADFTRLCINCSCSKSKERNGILGKVNINHFSEDIKAQIAVLTEGEFTKPIACGEHYIIYKRLEQNN